MERDVAPASFASKDADWSSRTLTADDESAQSLSGWKCITRICGVCMDSDLKLSGCRAGRTALCNRISWVLFIPPRSTSHGACEAKLVSAHAHAPLPFWCVIYDLSIYIYLYLSMV